MLDVVANPAISKGTQIEALVEPRVEAVAEQRALRQVSVVLFKDNRGKCYTRQASVCRLDHCRKSRQTVDNSCLSKFVSCACQYIRGFHAKIYSGVLPMLTFLHSDRLMNALYATLPEVFLCQARRQTWRVRRRSEWRCCDSSASLSPATVTSWVRQSHAKHKIPHRSKGYCTTL